MRCTSALVPGWALPVAADIPRGVPFAFTESGSFYDAVNHNSFIVVSQNAGLNWTCAGPWVAVLWQASNIRIIDFSPQ